jgi:hypothetical protein
VRAGRDVIGSPAAVYNPNGTLRQLQYVTDWWYRQAQFASGATPEGVALWSRYDLFGQGWASFGGGAIAVHAGRDIRDLDVSTPFSGYRVEARASKDDPAVTLPAESRWWPGGTLDVRAGGDIVGGLYFGGGPAATVVAGGAIATGATSTQPNAYPATQVLHGDTALWVGATGAVAIASPVQPAALAGAFQGIDRQPRTDVVNFVTPGARANIVSAAADVSLRGARPSPSTSGGSPGGAASTAPDELTVAAPSGRVDAGVISQRPVGPSTLHLLADGPVTVDAVRVVAAENASMPPRPEAQATIGEKFNPTTRLWGRAERPLVPDPGAEPLVAARLVSFSDDVSIAAGNSFVAGTTRVIAGRDVVLGASLLVQHAGEPQAGGGDAARSTTLLQAGRDLRIGQLGGLRVSGPGEVVAIAGRDIDFGRGQGIVSVGNQDNDLQLPAGGAQLTLVTGIGWGDYRQAVERRFHLLGSGFENFAAEALVQLEAFESTGRWLAPEAMLERAREFAELPLQEQRARVEQAFGADEVATGIESYLDAAVGRAESLSVAATEAAASGRVQGSNRLSETPPVPGSEFLPGQTLFPAGATQEQRDALQQSVREQLREALQARALADVIARRADRIDAAGREQLALRVSPYSEFLVRYVARVGGSPVGNPTDALRRFDALAPEQQAVFLNQVFGAELSVAGTQTLPAPDDAAASADATTSSPATPAAAAAERAAATALEPFGNRVQYLRGFDGMDALFPGARPAGRMTMSNSQVKTAQGGDIRLLVPGGTLNVGDLAGGGIAKSASDIGIVTVAGGMVDVAVQDSVEVNQSRIFTLAEGDLMLWARLGNLDAGRGAKTVVGAPPPLITINSQGQVVVDTSGSFSGSGIAVLGAESTANLFAPMGEINAGDAGITAAGRLNVGANTLANFDNVRAPNPVSSGNEPPPSTAGLAAVGQSATSAGTRVAEDRRQDEEDERRKRRSRRALLLEFLGFGRGD